MITTSTLRLLGLTLLFCIATANESRKSFFGHSVYHIHVDHDAHVEALRRIEQTHGLLLDFWMPLKTLPGVAHVSVPPSDQVKFLGFLKEKKIRHTVAISNLEEHVAVERAQLDARKIFKAGDRAEDITLNEYHNLTEIHAYLDSVAAQYPTQAQTGSIGLSHELRDLKYIKIGQVTSGNATSTRPAVFVNGCIHAREWLACATMVYIINQLTANSTAYADILNNVDVYVLPVLNPDGYVYTWTKDRMWRKTRSGPRNGCYGVDPNRNWNYQWNVVGASQNPCSETYDGPSPNSEVEVQNIINFLTANKNQLKAYFDIHTYSEDFMFPYGYADVLPVDVTKIRALAASATSAVNAVNKQKFKSGSITEIVYPASGSSIDYTKRILAIDYSFAMELRPTGSSYNGFVLPTSQIIPGAAEAWAGIQYVFRTAAQES